MQTQSINETALKLTEQVIRQNINAWSAQNKSVVAFFAKYDDEAYSGEVAPGRNRAIYLLGHLVAVSDGLFPLFGLGDRLYPELEEIFIKSPDRTFQETPSLAMLKSYWDTINNKLTEHFNTMTAENWLDKHTSVSAEDFALDPLRNKLNVLISRTIHTGYHRGQLTFLKQPATV